VARADSDASNNETEGPGAAQRGLPSPSVPDRDGDRRADVMISISSGSFRDPVQILSSRDGRRLAAFKP